MATMSAQIAGWAQVGGGPWRHAEYRLEVGFEGRTWVVYRRFSAFCDLDKSLREALGPEKAANPEVWTAELPAKIGSSAVSSFQAVVELRLPTLQTYLDTVLAYDAGGGERIAMEKAFGIFFDLDNKGASGATQELGATAVVRESFARTRDARHLLTLWHNYFIAVTNRGVLYVLKGLYDKPSEAVMSIPLVDSNLKVVAKQGDALQVDLVGDQRSLMLRFTSPNEAAAWMRVLADFVTPPPATRLTAEQKKAKKREALQEERKTAELRKAELPVENVRAKGTGNTTDELSQVYGM